MVMVSPAETSLKTIKGRDEKKHSLLEGSDKLKMVSPHRTFHTLMSHAFICFWIQNENNGDPLFVVALP